MPINCKELCIQDFSSASVPTSFTRYGTGTLLRLVEPLLLTDVHAYDSSRDQKVWGGPETLHL